MSYRTDTGYVLVNGTGVAGSLTVPAGVVVTDNILIVGGANNGPSSFSTAQPSASRAGYTVYTYIAPFKENNTGLAAYVLSGVQSGDTITVVNPAAGRWSWVGFIYTRALKAPGALTRRNGTSTASLIASAINVTPGTDVNAFTMSRQISSGTDLVSASNSNGRALTRRYKNYLAATDPGTNTALHTFVEPSSSSGVTTVTDSASSGNGVGFHFQEVDPPVVYNDDFLAYM